MQAKPFLRWKGASLSKNPFVTFSDIESDNCKWFEQSCKNTEKWPCQTLFSVTTAHKGIFVAMSSSWFSSFPAFYLCFSFLHTLYWFCYEKFSGVSGLVQWYRFSLLQSWVTRASAYLLRPLVNEEYFKPRCIYKIVLLRLISRWTASVHLRSEAFLLWRWQQKFNFLGTLSALLSGV